MKTKLLTGTLLITTILNLCTSCKKGEDDPAFSLRTRKARVTGEWKAVQGTSYTSNEGIDYKNTQEVTYTENTFNGIQIETSLNDIKKVTYAGKYSYEITLDKNGNYEINQTSDGKEFYSKGRWNFTGNIGKNKNKQQLVLTQTNNNGRNITGNFVNQTFDIKELRNKKMVLTNEFNTEIAGYIQKQKTEFTFELK